MATKFDFFQKQALSLGLTDLNEMKKYIREEQTIEMERSLKEIEVNKKMEIEQMKRNKKIETEEREKMKRLEIEAEKLKSEIVLQEQR